MVDQTSSFSIVSRSNPIFVRLLLVKHGQTTKFSPYFLGWTVEPNVYPNLLDEILYLYPFLSGSCNLYPSHYHDLSKMSQMQPSAATSPRISLISCSRLAWTTGRKTNGKSRNLKISTWESHPNDGFFSPFSMNSGDWWWYHWFMYILNLLIYSGDMWWWTIHNDSGLLISSFYGSWRNYHLAIKRG